MGRVDVIEAFLSRRKAKQVRGLLMTDGTRLYWGTDLIASWGATGKFVDLVPICDVLGRPAPQVVWNLVHSLT